MAQSSIPHLPDCISSAQGNDFAEITFTLCKEHDCFVGHFPGLPLIPGVVQIHWAIQLYQRAFGGTPTSELKNLKFMLPLLEEHNINLRVSKTASGQTFKFEYRHDGKLASSGIVQLATDSSKEQ